MMNVNELSGAIISLHDEIEGIMLKLLCLILFCCLGGLFYVAFRDCANEKALKHNPAPEQYLPQKSLMAGNSYSAAITDVEAHEQPEGLRQNYEHTAKILKNRFELIRNNANNTMSAFQ